MKLQQRRRAQKDECAARCAAAKRLVEVEMEREKGSTSEEAVPRYEEVDVEGGRLPVYDARLVVDAKERGS